MKISKYIINLVGNLLLDYNKQLDNSILTKKVKYPDVISIESLKAGLKRTKSNMFPGLDGQVKTNFTEEKILVLHKELVSQKYKPKPTKKINIIKSDGSKYSLGISSQKDKIVQSALLNHLEPILEQIFLDCSYGFRPKKNCHNALKEIKSKWQNITWFIKIDINNSFNKIHHQILIEKIKQFCDQATTELIIKLLNEGYIDIRKLANSVERVSEGIPQGSVLTPILINLYLHTLDCYIHNKLFPQWNLGNENDLIFNHETPNKLTTQEKSLLAHMNIPELEETITKLKYNQWILKTHSSESFKNIIFRQLKYIRYADELLFGFTGPKAEAILIKQDVEHFLTEELKIDQTKSQIFHSSDQGIKFLNFYLKYIFVNKIIEKKNSYKKERNIYSIEPLKQSPIIGRVQLRIPIEDLLIRAVKGGYAKERKDNKSSRATSCRKLTSLSDKDIVIHFSSIIKNLLQYYCPANHYSDLWAIVSLYRKSCALTLADKHKLKTAATIYKRYGPKLKVNDSFNSSNNIELYYPESLKSTGNFRIDKIHITTELLVETNKEENYKQNIKTNRTYHYPVTLKP